MNTYNWQKQLQQRHSPLFLVLIHSVVCVETSVPLNVTTLRQNTVAQPSRPPWRASGLPRPGVWRPLPRP